MKIYNVNDVVVFFHKGEKRAGEYVGPSGTGHIVRLDNTRTIYKDNVAAAHSCLTFMTRKAGFSDLKSR